MQPKPPAKERSAIEQDLRFKRAEYNTLTILAFLETLSQAVDDYVKGNGPEALDQLTKSLGWWHANPDTPYAKIVKRREKARARLRETLRGVTDGRLATLQKIAGVLGKTIRFTLEDCDDTRVTSELDRLSAK